MHVSNKPLIATLFGAAMIISPLALTPAQAIDLNPLSAIKGMVEAAVEDRSAEDIATDLKIKTKITAEVIDKMGAEVISISADVYEQDVMLTGLVETEQLKKKAETLTRGIAGVKALYNDIMVTPPIDRKKGAAEAFVDDTVIESKINALLLDAGGVNVTNFRWRSVQGNVFLFGRALSERERDKAISVIRDIKNVASLTSRVKIRPKK
ncbi:MAG: BON domain-containing protein [Rhodospirillales bacterium]|nr:BON domain-containing protein [Rhodospirillales bacterium]MCW8969648.1 BON domain-containing protein [Rhodospirillales bacterium]